LTDKNNEANSRKEKKIELSLKEVAKQFEHMEADFRSASKNVPAPARKLEERIQKLHSEMDEISDKMLAHKLQRLAESKMLEEIGRKKQALLVQDKSKAPAQSSSSSEEYQSSTFKCKSDLDKCLQSSKNALDKALCFTLFIRCVVKG
jgi:hypothetical protein